MSQQASLESFFGKRKRICSDDPRTSQKVLLLEADTEETSTNTVKGSNFRNLTRNQFPESDDGNLRTVVLVKKPSVVNSVKTKSEIRNDESPRKSSVQRIQFQILGGLSPKKNPVSRVLYSADKSESSKKKPNGQGSAKKLFKDKETSKEGTNQKKMAVLKNAKDLMERMREKSVKPKNEETTVKDNPAQEGPSNSVDIIKAANDLVQKMKAKKLGEKLASKNIPLVETTAKELSFGQIKKKLLGSSRLSELKEKMEKFQEKTKSLDDKSVPTLTKFNSLEFEIPKSPVKSVLHSPHKSPVKPAYQRYASLAEPTVTLSLPFSYQKLYDLFCAVDTVCSMLINRGETITFSKLKPAVQELTRKNFLEHHLGQIATMFPTSFNFRQEKLKNFGSTSKADKYELVITPTIPNSVSVAVNIERTPTKVNPDDIIRDADKTSMSPKVLKERREKFHKALLEKTKDYHEDFLKTLQPPVVIPRHALKRWHPDFMIDHVPDIIPAELPQPPFSDKPCSAQDVLERARNFLTNKRLQKALETTSETFNTPPSALEQKTELKKEVAPSDSLLKGIPKALLEKVKARQAAKALEFMTQSPQESQEALMYTRLPELARILRTCYVNEQKGVLAWEIVIDKIRFSSKLNMSSSEAEGLLKLLMKTCPEWLTVHRLRNMDFLKINKTLNIKLLMARLEKIAEEKVKFT